MYIYKFDVKFKTSLSLTMLTIARSDEANSIL